MNHPRAFVSVFLGLTVLATTAMMAINVIVDPFWRFDLVNIHSFNARRTSVFDLYARLGKAGVVCRLRPPSRDLGTSRVEVGIDPTLQAGQRAQPVYNLGLAGMGLNELILTLQHAIHASPRSSGL